MRGYFTTTVAVADAIVRDGFTDFYEFAGLAGVRVADGPPDADDRFRGPVTLCQGVSEDEY
jgi:hypothetical protein